MSDTSRLQDFCRDLTELCASYAATDVRDPAIESLKRIAKKAGQLERFARELIAEHKP